APTPVATWRPGRRCGPPSPADAVGEHRELDARPHAQLAEHAPEVDLDRADRQVELVRRLPVRRALDDEERDVELALGELVGPPPAELGERLVGDVALAHREPARVRRRGPGRDGGLDAVPATPERARQTRVLG